MLRWRMKSDVRDIYAWTDRHGEGLNRAIKILVVQRVFVVPDSGSRIADFVTHKPDAVVSRVRLGLRDCRALSGRDDRYLAYIGANGAKTESRRATSHALLLIGDIIIHVTLARVTLAPGVLMRDDVLRFRKISGTQILCWDKIIRLHQYSM